jgi:hypothetical protein
LSLIRVVKTAAATLTRSIYVDETATDAGGVVTVEVTRLDGTVVTSGTATDAAGTGNYSFILPGGPTSPTSATWQLDHLNVAWTGSFGGATVTLTDRVEVVGGFLFGLAEARSSDASLADQGRYSTQTLADKRVEVEQECERICGWAFVPRFNRVVLRGDGSDVITLPHQKIRRLRAVTTRVIAGEAYTAVAALTDLAVTEGGIITRYDGGVFPYGTGSTIVEYEHGWDYPPEDLKEAAMYRLRSRLNMTRSGIPDRASFYSTADGASYRLTLPGPDSTGIPEVDAIYQSYKAAPVGFA